MNWLNLPLFAPILGPSASQTQAGYALDTAYGYLTAGNKCVLYRFACPVEGSLSSVYIYCTALSGTPANISIKVELRDYDNTTVPGSTLLATKTVSVTTSAGWTQVTFDSPVALTLGQFYFLVVGNASAVPGTDYPTVITAGGVPLVGSRLYCRTSSNGAASSSGGTSPAVVLAFSGGAVSGSPYTSNGNQASNTLERGLFWPANAEAIKIAAVLAILGAPATRIKIVKSSTAPAAAVGTGEQSTIIRQSGIGLVMLDEFTLLAGQAYRILIGDYVGNSNAPAYATIDDYSRYSDVQACAGYGFGGYYTRDNGSGGWTDEPEKMPIMSLAVSEIVASSGSSPGRVLRGRVLGGVR